MKPKPLLMILAECAGATLGMALMRRALGADDERDDPGHLVAAPSDAPYVLLAIERRGERA